MKTGRRGFLGTAVGALALAAVGGCATAGSSAAGGTRRAPRVGFAGYTFYKFKPEEVVDRVKRSGALGLCIKDSFVGPKATAAELAERKRMLADAGIVAYGAGPIYIGDADEMKRRFDYAAALGVPKLVGVPFRPGADGSVKWGHQRSSRELCELASRLADEYRIDFAIHNHGNDPKYGVPTLYPTPESTYAMIADLSPRMGLCMDIAYTFSDGYDPAEEIRKYADRLFDVHLRNISDPKNGSSGTAGSMGVIDYAPIMRALREVGYSRWCGIELANAFGKDGDPDWLADSVGYFKALA